MQWFVKIIIFVLLAGCGAEQGFVTDSHDCLPTWSATGAPDGVDTSWTQADADVPLVMQQVSFSAATAQLALYGSSPSSGVLFAHVLKESSHGSYDLPDGLPADSLASSRGGGALGSTPDWVILSLSEPVPAGDFWVLFLVDSAGTYSLRAVESAQGSYTVTDGEWTRSSSRQVHVETIDCSGED